MKLAFWRRPRRVTNREILDHVQDLRSTISHVLSRPRPCGVSVLHQLEGSPGWLISHHSFELRSGEVSAANVFPQTTIAKGALLVAWGPCSIVEAMVGGCVQNAWPDGGGGPTVITDRACAPGQILKILVKGWGA